ncbi:hypothetical protein ACFPVT_08080 [Corynebacterium choanae]|uniref:Uncharacterized protein n=1 Tax=Corynebacterium choanae TaxID=1862358 RepID=A0A3G6J8D6_9CORY|nr:hypothetical protein [Corynebacterium choanae]AZA14072.1 hypothetical protein CCHOA_08415 [Corynebacterium choanae]
MADSSRPPASSTSPQPVQPGRRYQPKKVTGVKIALAGLILLVVIGWLISLI